MNHPNICNKLNITRSNTSQCLKHAIVHEEIINRDMITYIYIYMDKGL